MAGKLVREETPMEFFREQLERAMEHQKVSTSAFTEFYLVNLLVSCVRGEEVAPWTETGNAKFSQVIRYGPVDLCQPAGVSKPRLAKNDDTRTRRRLTFFVQRLTGNRGLRSQPERQPGNGLARGYGQRRSE